LKQNKEEYLSLKLIADWELSLRRGRKRRKIKPGTFKIVTLNINPGCNLQLGSRPCVRASYPSIM